MANFHFELVSPEKLLFSGDVQQVDVPGVEGDFGVLADHAPMVTTLRPGILTVHTAGTGAAEVHLPGLPHELALRIRDHLLPRQTEDAV